MMMGDNLLGPMKMTVYCNFQRTHNDMKSWKIPGEVRKGQSGYGQVEKRQVMYGQNILWVRTGLIRRGQLGSMTLSIQSIAKSNIFWTIDLFGSKVKNQLRPASRNMVRQCGSVWLP